MAQASWASDTNNWSASPYIWYNTTYQDAITFGNTLSDSALPVDWNYKETTWASDTHSWDYVAPDITYFNIGKKGIATLGSNVTALGTGGFAFVGDAVLGASVGTEAANNAVYVDSITVAATNTLDSIGNQLFIDAITLGSTVGIPQSDLVGWAATSGTWAANPDNWNYGAPSVVITVAADLTQINLSELHEEDATKLASATLGTSVGATASGNLAVPVAITLSNNQNLKFNINFEESITIEGTSNITSSNNFLWNDQEEDASTLWTKISDPDA